MEREFKIKGLMMDPINQSPIVILQGVEKNTLLPIWVGIFEANAIALQIERIEPARPMTHDLLKNVLLQLNANVDKIVVTDLQVGHWHGHARKSVAVQDFPRIG